MNKIKISTKHGNTQLIIKGQNGQHISEREIIGINNNSVQGFIHVEYIPKGSTFNLGYNISGLVTFRDFLKRPLNKNIFMKILNNLLKTSHSVKNAGFPSQYIMLDADYVMINPVTNNLYLIAIPIQGFNSGCILRNFLFSIIQFGMFANNEDNSYVKDYIQMLNGSMNFSIHELEEYINRCSGESVNIVDNENTMFVGEDKECPRCHMRLQGDSLYCVSCGMKLDEIAYENRHSDEYEYHDYTNDEDDDYEATTVLNADMEGTTLLDSNIYERRRHPYILRVKDKEKIFVDSEKFHIGRAKKDNNYAILGNSAISRTHAIIINRNGKYFIRDLNSANKTYVEGKVIVPDTEVEIFAGNKISFADEDFIFNEE